MRERATSVDATSVVVFQNGLDTSRSHLGWDLGGNELQRFQFFNLLPALGLWLIPLILYRGLRNERLST